MEVITTVSHMGQRQMEVPRPIGLVPTMGYLHEGHLSLVRQARQENATVVVSIFINPTQFGPKDDLDTYPQALSRDIKFLDLEGVDLVFNPSMREIYPPGFDTYVEPGTIGHLLEGCARPGHFRGVATIVTKLFTIIRPDQAYFGEKDGQQIRVIQRLNSDLNLGVRVRPCPTKRESDGLALSSRNVYLNGPERLAAPRIFEALTCARELYLSGTRDATYIRQAVEKLLGADPLITLDYVSVADTESLEELQQIKKGAMVSVAVFVGKARLIDNIVVGNN